MNKTACLLVTLLIASVSHAHHGANSQFDQTKSLEVEGVITKLRFVNPHSYVYFDVSKGDGSVENWRCEMRAATVLKRSGWSEDMFSPGTPIRIEGVPARREPFGCYINRFQLGEGDVIERYEQLSEADNEVDLASRPATLANGQPNISGDWAAAQRIFNEGEVRDRSINIRVPMEYAQSEAGIAAGADFVLNRDNPRYHCMAVNVMADWVFDQHINRIAQSDDTITLSYGFMDIVRTIHLGMKKHPKKIELTRAGHSIGHWQGNVLVVDTIGFLPGYLEGRFGIKHSNQLHLVEQFEYDHEQGALIRNYTGDDPLYLAESFSSRDAVFLSATPFDPYNCDDLTTEIVDGH